MKQRGRPGGKSGDETVVTGVFSERPSPPEDLTPEQAAEWRAIVDRMPINWFTPETWPMLTQLCGHITGSRLLRQKIATFEPGLLDFPEGFRRFEKLKKLYDKEGNSIARLMTKLRLTPQSRYDGNHNKRAFTAIQNTAPGPKPWDR